jgi:signal transduction histidine kinase
MLCKEFLARNGGEMLIASEPGKGSRFSFTIPKPG